MKKNEYARKNASKEPISAEESARLVEEFLANGGEVTAADPGDTALDDHYSLNKGMAAWRVGHQPKE
jgi:hypothetical protein